MKFDELRSIAHNIADSLASGVGLPISVYGTNIFGEAVSSPEGFITVDFLTGKSEGALPSSFLKRAITEYRDAFAALCRKHGTSPSAYREMTARYSEDIYGRRLVVTLEDNRGRRSVDEYIGTPGRRVKVLDQLGRIRPK